MAIQGDYLVRAIAFDGEIRAFSVRTTETVKTIAKRLDLWPAPAAALGRTISAGAMMGAMLKGKERLSIQIVGGGPIGKIIVEVDAIGNVRGYVTNPHVDLPLNEKGKIDVSGAVGKDGTLYVIKDLGGKEPYRGSAPLVSGEIAEDLTYYFAASEQTPSAVALGVFVSPEGEVIASGGFILQVMPEASEETISFLEEKLAGLPAISSLVEKGLTPEEILGELFGERVEILHRLPVAFHCGCSFEKSLTALYSLDTESLKAYVEKKEEPEIVCQFCHERYLIPLEKVEALIKEREEGNPPVMS